MKPKCRSSRIIRASNTFFTQTELNLRQKRWMEFVANYDLDISYHSAKTNLVADALRSRRADVSAENEFERVERMIRTLHLNALSKDQEPLGRSAGDQVDLLTRIRIAQGKDKNMKKLLRKTRPSTTHPKMGRSLSVVKLVCRVIEN